MSGQALIVDTDPGIDDALALQYLLALNSAWSLKAITVVAGNVPLEPAFSNARALAALMGIEGDVPVYGGCSKPLVRGLRTAEYIYGEDGVGGARLPRPAVSRRPEHAVHIIGELGRRYAGELIIIALGPLTNIAAALILDPSLSARIRRLVFMGGAINAPGNVPPGSAEFNIHVDPEAARLVVESGIPYTMVGLDATSKAVLTREQVGLLDDGCAPLAFAREMLDHYLGTFRGREKCALHDPLAVAVAHNPEWVKMRTGNLYVETRGEFTCGKTSFVSRELRARRNIEDLEPASAVGQVALGLARKDFPVHFVAALRESAPSTQ